MDFYQEIGVALTSLLCGTVVLRKEGNERLMYIFLRRYR